MFILVKFLQMSKYVFSLRQQQNFCKCLNMFFFASTAESRATSKKLVLDRVSKFGWMKN